MSTRAIFGWIFFIAAAASPAGAAILDLTTLNSAGTINDAIFQQYSPPATGSGNIESFVRIQATGTEQGYNTDARPVEFDENTSLTFTHSLLLSEVSIVSFEGIDYREFMLDINQVQSSILSLDELRIAMHSSGGLYGYSTIFASPVYDLDAGEESWIKLDYSLNSGSGSGDMLAFIPDSLFTGANQYIYLYSKFGVNFSSDDGFEEWAHGVNGPIIPEPVTGLTLCLGAMILLRKRRL